MLKLKIYLLQTVLFLSAIIFPSAATEIWVSTKGSDLNPGSREAPLATVHMALRKAREIRRLSGQPLAEEIEILIEGGQYQFVDPLLIRPEDSGTEESPTVTKAVADSRPVFSGGVKVEGWK